MKLTIGLVNIMSFDLQVLITLWYLQTPLNNIAFIVDNPKVIAINSSAFIVFNLQEKLAKSKIYIDWL